MRTVPPELLHPRCERLLDLVRFLGPLLGFAQVDDDEDEEAYEGQGTDDLSALLDQFSSAAAAEVEVDTGASGSGSTDSVEPPEPEPALADSSSAAPDLDFPIFAPIEIDLASREPPEPVPEPASTTKVTFQARILRLGVIAPAFRQRRFPRLRC